MDEFIASASNPLAMYFLQPEAADSFQSTTAPRLDLGLVKESWIEKEMRARESEFTEHSNMQYVCIASRVESIYSPLSLPENYSLP